MEFASMRCCLFKKTLSCIFTVLPYIVLPKSEVIRLFKRRKTNFLQTLQKPTTCNYEYFN